MDAQPKDTNYDESRVPDYELPDPLKAADGSRVDSVESWKTRRRPEILSLFQDHVYGGAPGRPDGVRTEVFDVASDAFGGKAKRKQVAVFLGSAPDALRMDILVYLPRDAKRSVPLFVGLNFRGNHATTDDPAVRLARLWSRDEGKERQADPSTRGSASSRWPVESIVDRGYGVATIYCGDIDPDFHDGFKNGVHALFEKDSAEKRPANAWGTIGAWAWGLSRAMDYFETDDEIDHRRVAVLGHSRLGKTALWAGARDERFAIVISNNSGCGGAALSRRRFGETVERINSSFPHWFCENFKKYNRNEGALPVDQHMLIALMAPRPVYVASATEDRWADPKGEFLAAKHAEPVYRLFGKSGLSSDSMPPAGTPLHGTIGYHLRSGRHDITAYDWKLYMDFADRHFERGAAEK